MLRTSEGQGTNRRSLRQSDLDRDNLCPDGKSSDRQIPIITMGYGRGDSKNGAVFTWNFPLLGTYWTAADIMIQHIAKELGGEANLTGKKISLLYHDSPFGKEPIPALEALSQRYGSPSRRSRLPIRASNRNRSGSR